MVRALAGLFLFVAATPVLAQPADWPTGAGRHRSGARILVLRSYHLPAGDTAHGPVIVFGGSATIDGHADDDVVVLLGRLRVGPRAVVDGKVVTLGGVAVVDPRARIRGGVDETLVRLPRAGSWPPLSRTWYAGLAVAATILRLFLVFAVASVLALVAPGWVRRISWRVAEGMTSSAAIGVLCEVAFVPVLLLVVVALAASIVGIPLLGAVPVLVAGAGVAATAGFAAVAARIGARLRGTTVEASNALIVDVVLGFLAVSAVTLVARLAALGAFWTTPAAWSVSAAGLFIEYAVWTIGIGAACASLLARWQGPQASRTTAAMASPTVV